MNNASTNTLNKVKIKLRDLSKELLQVWNQRQKKTALQQMTIDAFGKIHDQLDPAQYCQKTLQLLQDLVESLPPRQSETIDANACHEGFMNWNNYWNKFASKRDHEAPIKNVHLTYQSWVKENNGKFCQFQELYELCMIRSTSEAACETVGSIMKLHAGSSRHLEPVYFSKEIVLRYNLGPIHTLLKKGFADEVFNRDKKEYVRRTDRPDKITTKDLTKSSGIGTFEEKEEEKSHFPLSFWEI